MTIQHDSMVHDGVCSTECQHAQPRDDSSTQPMDGPHAQPRDGPWPHARTKHVRELVYIAIIICVDNVCYYIAEIIIP